METFLIYAFKMILTSGVMFLYYVLFLKDKTFHHYNRFYLIATVLISCLLPFLKVDYFTMEISPDIYKILKPVEVYYSEQATDSSWTKVILFSALSIALFLLVKFLIGIQKIFRLKKEYVKKYFKGISFYNTNLENAPFSFFRNLFWREDIALESDLGKQILKHEMVHIEQKHTYDKMILEIFWRIFWFNPIFILIKKELYLIHEYLADKKAVKNKNTKTFAKMLLETHFATESIPATNPFIHSNLKKRLKMLQKSKTKRSYLRKLAVLPVLFAVSFLLLVNAQNKEVEKVNKEVKISLSKIKQDTVKNKITYETSYVAFYNDEGNAQTKEREQRQMQTLEKDIFKRMKPTDVFKVNGKKVSKAKFKKFFKKNYKNKNFRMSFTSGTKTSKKVCQASLSNQKEPEITIINSNNSVNIKGKKYYYIEDKEVSKKAYQDYLKKYQGKNGFSKMHYKNACDNTQIFSAIFGKDAERHQKAVEKAKKAVEKAKRAVEEAQKKANKEIIADIYLSDEVPTAPRDKTIEVKAIYIADDKVKATNTTKFSRAFNKIYVDEKLIKGGTQKMDSLMKSSPNKIKSMTVDRNSKVIHIFTK